jgi:hypothetical protein
MEDLAGGLGVAHGGVVGDSEHCGQVKGVRAAVECFLELSIDAESVKRCAKSGEELDDGVVAHRAGVVGSLAGHQQVRVGCVGPCLAAKVQVGEQGSAGQLLNASGAGAGSLGRSAPDLVGADVGVLGGQ